MCMLRRSILWRPPPNRDNLHGFMLPSSAWMRHTYQHTRKDACIEDSGVQAASVLAPSQVAAEALSATEVTLQAKLDGLEKDAADRRTELARLKRQHDSVAAELAGAEADLSSASTLLGSAKAHLALKESLLLEKNTLIADLRRRTSGSADAPAASATALGFWRSLGRLRRPSSEAQRAL